MPGSALLMSLELSACSPPELSPRTTSSFSSFSLRFLRQSVLLCFAGIVPSFEDTFLCIGRSPFSVVGRRMINITSGAEGRVRPLECILQIPAHTWYSGAVHDLDLSMRSTLDGGHLRQYHCSTMRPTVNVHSRMECKDRMRPSWLWSWEGCIQFQVLQFKQSGLSRLF